MNREQAIALYESGFWKDMSLEDRARFQLFEPRLCMPFGVFQEAVEKTLDRPVYTHEFGASNIAALRAEFNGDKPAPTLEDILNLIPQNKRLVIVVSPS